MQLTNFKKVLGNKVFWLLVFLMVICFIYLNQFTLVIKDPVITEASGRRTGITLPYIKEMPETEYVISGKINYHRFLSAATVHIKPDDRLLSIRVNQRDISLASIDPSVLQNLGPGFDFNLGRYLRDGSNDLEIKIWNKDGDSGLFFESSGRDIKTLIADWLLWISILGILYLILSCFIADKIVILVILGGFLIRVLYYLVTPYDVRQHDVWEHWHYIEYIIKNGALPPLRYNLETYQPPVYYVTSALIYKLANLLGVVNSFIITRWLQFYSLLLSMGFVLAAFYVFKNIFTHLSILNKPEKPAGMPETGKANVKRDWPLLVMLSLVAFWPVNIIHSVRIGNDVMFYFFFAWALLFLIKWHYDNTDRSLYTGLIFTTFCMITKANGIILYGVAGLIFLWKFIKDPILKKYLIKAALFFAIFCAGFLITFGTSIDEKLSKPSNEHFMVGGTNELGGLRVGNQLRNFLWLDLPKFISEPYVSWEDQGSRQYFWNYLFRTGLVGEFYFESGLQEVLAIIFSVLFLGMLLYTIFGLVMILRTEFKEHLVLFFSLVLLLIAAILIRISLPYTCLNDFRYILPILISFCFFYGYTIFICRRRGWVALKIAGYSMTLLFVACSIVFFVRMQF